MSEDQYPTDKIPEKENDLESIQFEDDTEDLSQGDTLDLVIPSGEPETVAQEIVQKIADACQEEHYHHAFGYLNYLYNLHKEHAKIQSIFIFLVEGINTIIRTLKTDLNEYYIVGLTSRLVKLMKKHQDKDAYLAPLSGSIHLAIETLRECELLEELEEHLNDLVNLSIDFSDNHFIRVTAAEAIIEATIGFGEDWNYDKTKHFGELLRGLLPPDEVEDYFQAILLKGLAMEIDVYGDMHEFNAMARSLTCLQQVFERATEKTEEIVTFFAFGLEKAINWFGEEEKYNEMIEHLVALKELVNEYAEFDSIQISYAEALRIALDHSGAMEDLGSTTALAKDLLVLAEEKASVIEIQSNAIIGIFKAASWACAFWETGLMRSFLDRVKTIHNRLDQDQRILLLYTRGLFNLTRELAQIGKKKSIKEIVSEIAALHQQYPDNLAVKEYYAGALVNLIFLLGETMETLPELPDYLNTSRELLLENTDNSEIALSFAKTLVNAIRAYGLYGMIDEMEETLEELSEFCYSSDDEDIFIRLGKGIVLAVKAYGEVGELNKIVPLLADVKSWADEDPLDIELQLIHLKALVNVISSYGKNNRKSEMLFYLDEARVVARKFPSLRSLQIQLAKGLSLVIRWLAAEDDLSLTNSLLYELQTKAMEFRDESEIQEALARSTRRVIVLAHKQNNTALVEELLTKLRSQLLDYFYLEGIQVELARTLSNLILAQVSNKDSSYVNSLIMELNGLVIQFPRNAKLSAIHQTVAPLLEES